MCGISGLVTDRLAPATARQVVEEMNQALRHRGPDGEGVWDDELAYLGHRRLAIIDLSTSGTQPMANEDGTLVLVCNGEIYNFKALRASLVAAGHRFRSHTDVEVILHLYEDHGDECVRHLVGMFAFALWDTRRRRLLIARDRIGEKPLYYAHTAKGFVFASEIGAVLSAPDLGIDRTLDEEAITASLVYSASPAPLTMFAGLRALPPASRLVYEGSRARIDRYWAIDCSRRRSLRDAEAAEELDGLLRTAVGGALIADVPVGVLLSGGVDSSAIAVHARRENAAVQAFSIAHDSVDRPDPDLARARQVAGRLQLPHREIPFAAVDLSLLPHILRGYGQPFNVFPMLYADRLAASVRQHVKVALGGNGADEVFGGYRGYNRQLVAEAVTGMVGAAPRWTAAIPGFGGGRIERLRAAAGEPIEERRGRLFDQLSYQTGAALFTREFAARARMSHPGRFIAEYSRECAPREYLDAVMYSDLMVYHQHGTTVITDVSGMAHALEIRAPFLDHRVIEFAFSLPRRLKIRSLWRPNYNKYVLKRSVEQRLPRGVLYGRKYGFGYNISFPELLAGPWQGAVEAFVRRGRYLELGIFSRDGAERAVSRSPADVWRLLVFSIWAELYVFGESADTLGTKLLAAISPAGTRQVA